MTARDLEKAVQQCSLLVPCAEVAALLDHRIVTGEHSIPREQHSAVLTAGLPRTEILKSPSRMDCACFCSDKPALVRAITGGARPLPTSNRSGESNPRIHDPES